MTRPASRVASPYSLHQPCLLKLQPGHHPMEVVGPGQPQDDHRLRI
jgi:hypothetical protein